MSEALEVLAAALAVVVAVERILAAIAKARADMRETGKLDLDKTLEAARDAAAEVRKLKKDGHIQTLEEALDEGVKKVEDLRGKKLSGKLARKARARIGAIVGGDE